jgi:hypothetical protein
MSQLFRKQVDNMMDAYVGWHEAMPPGKRCVQLLVERDRAPRQSRFLAVHSDTRRGGAGGRGLAGTVRRVGRLVMSGHDAGGPLGAPPWGASAPIRRRG